MMQNMLMDMLRALATPNMDIRKKTLDIALDLINQHNIDEVMPLHATLLTAHPPIHVDPSDIYSIEACQRFACQRDALKRHAHRLS